MKRLHTFGFILILFLVFYPPPAFCMGTKPELKEDWKHANLVQAYALIYDISDKQKNLEMLLLVKTASPSTSESVNEISLTYRNLFNYLKSLKIHGQQIAKAQTGLPPAEVASRNLIQKIKTKQLMSRSGVFFELTLLSTQVEALTYSSALLQQIAEHETIPKNKTQALAYQNKINAHLKKIWEMLEVNK